MVAGDFSIPTMSGDEVVQELDPLYPEIKTPLEHSSAFQLLIATVLSAQATDEQINRITPTLFGKYSAATSMAKAPIRSLERIVKSSGFYHVKARRIKEISKKLEENFGGKVPDTMEELLQLPGVGRKTANIVLSAGYEKIEGIAVDTHVFRLSRRIGLTSSNTPEKVEEDLMKITSRPKWPRLTLVLILHGRTICFARKPLCEKCVLSDRCLYYSTTFKKKE
jgi:endonuclease III